MSIWPSVPGSDIQALNGFDETARFRTEGDRDLAQPLTALRRRHGPASPPPVTGRQAIANLATYSSKGSMPTSARSSSIRSGSSQGHGSGVPSFTPAICVP
ncbi:hypothetical protein SAMN02787144_101860 [Streptomyces atratus]|uniref:Uncharacterized protein n=1 Tax=Streptomyces atratus TaxID=1893 RepID=A0A1K2ECY0_STRAR|nr:hypothetical protein SAMN02787144_101860 [Streptomyces atratus]